VVPAAVPNVPIVPAVSTNEVGFKSSNGSKCSKRSIGTRNLIDLNGAKRLELLEPLERLEPTGFNDLNGAQRLNGLNVLNEFH
jgi:hypothetical protein